RHTNTALQGWVDLSRGVDAFADDAVRRQLAPLGAPTLTEGLAALTRQGATVPSFAVSIDAALPGRVSATNGTRVGSLVHWDLPLGQTTNLMAKASARNRLNLLLAAISVAAVGLLGLVG